MRVVKGVEDKIVHSFLQHWVIFSAFVLLKHASQTSFLFTVILNTLLLVITRGKQTIDHLHIYRIILGSVSKVGAG